MTAFAEATDLAIRLGTTFDATQEAQATAAIAGASARIRRHIRRELTSDTYTLTIPSTTDSRIDLPERPVTSVASVTMDGVAITDYTRIGDSLYRELGWAPRWDAVSVDGRMPAWSRSEYATRIPVPVVVIYVGGYATAPDDVKDICLAVAAGVVADPTGIVTSEKVDDYAVTYAKAAASGLSAADLAVLKFYRRGAFTVPQ